MEVYRALSKILTQKSSIVQSLDPPPKKRDTKSYHSLRKYTDKSEAKLRSLFGNVSPNAFFEEGPILEHGPWVVGSRKLTRGRPLFLSITRIVCGNINTVREWLWVEVDTLFLLKNSHVCVAVRIIPAFAKKKNLCGASTDVPIPKELNLYRGKTFFIGPLVRARPSGGTGTRRTRQFPFQLFTNGHAPSMYSGFILI